MSFTIDGKILGYVEAGTFGKALDDVTPFLQAKRKSELEAFASLYSQCSLRDGDYESFYVDLQNVKSLLPLFQRLDSDHFSQQLSQEAKDRIHFVRSELEYAQKIARGLEINRFPGLKGKPLNNTPLVKKLLGKYIPAADVIRAQRFGKGPAYLGRIDIHDSRAVQEEHLKESNRNYQQGLRHYAKEGIEFGTDFSLHYAQVGNAEFVDIVDGALCMIDPDMSRRELARKTLFAHMFKCQHADIHLHGIEKEGFVAETQQLRLDQFYDEAVLLQLLQRNDEVVERLQRLQIPEDGILPFVFGAAHFSDTGSLVEEFEKKKMNYAVIRPKSYRHEVLRMNKVRHQLTLMNVVFRYIAKRVAAKKPLDDDDLSAILFFLRSAREYEARQISQDELARSITQTMSTTPLSFLTLYVAARILESAGIEGAQRLYQEIVKGDPSFVEAHVALANHSHEQRKYLEASTSATKAIALDPTTQQAYLILGSAEASQGNVQSAIDAYEKALELGAVPFEVPLALGELYEKQGKYFEARRAFQKYEALIRHSEDPAYTIVFYVEAYDKKTKMFLRFRTTKNGEFIFLRYDRTNKVHQHIVVSKGLERIELQRRSVELKSAMTQMAPILRDYIGTNTRYDVLFTAVLQKLQERVR